MGGVSGEERAGVKRVVRGGMMGRGEKRGTSGTEL